MATPTYQEYLNALVSPNRKQLIKIEMLYKNETGFESYNEISQDISNTNGTLSITFQNGIRRKLSFLINNPLYKYKIDPNGLLWLDSYFKLSIGLQISDNYIYWTDQGIFVLDDSTMKSSSPSSKSIEINALDLASLLDGTLGGYLESSYSIANGNLLKDSVQSILVDSGSNSPIIFDSIYDDYTTSYTITVDIGSRYTDLLDKLAEFRTSNYYFDNNNFCFRSGIDDIDDASKPVLYSFTTDGSDINLISSEVKYNIEKVKNYIKVVGDTVNSQTFCGVSYNDDPSSSTSITKIGLRPAEPLTIDNIESDQYCVDRSLYELKKYYRMAMTVTIVCLPVLLLDVNNVIELTDSHYGFDHQKLLIQSISWDLKDGGTQTLTCSNIFDVDYTTITGVVN